MHTPILHLATAASRGRGAALLASLLLLAAPLGLVAAATTPSALVVPAGSVRIVDGVLESAGDLVVDGEVRALAGDLVLRATGDIVVRGRIVGAHGASGEPGGSVLLSAGRAVIVAEGGHVGAGPGGHGESAIVPDGVARGGRGGDGGRIVVEAPSTSLDGILAPGRGGDGGHAYGIEASGGDGGTTGGLVVNGELVAARALAAQPDAQPPLGDLLPAEARTHCPPAQSALPGLAGANGGSACAHGTPGGHGANGNPGSDDNCNTCTQGNHPPCNVYTLDGSDNRNGEVGQNGGTWVGSSPSHAGPPTQGGDATAVGGLGGHVAAPGVQAGNGGNAVATGGIGGNGGNGGEGGHAGTLGQGCSGGSGGYGAPGGNGFATAGGQGLNPTDCPRNGSPGAVSGIGGNGGNRGTGGPGGGPSGRAGSTGAHGQPGTPGYGSAVVPPAVVCVAPGAPTVTTSYVGLRPFADECDRVRVLIKAPVAGSNSAAVTHYEIYRNDTSGNMAVLASNVSYGGSPQVYVDGDVVEGVTYAYQVRAHSTLGPGPRSAVATQTTTCIGLETLEGPVGKLFPLLGAPILTAAPGSAPGSVSLSIAWPHASTVDWYAVYRALTLVGPYTHVMNVTYGGTTTQATDIGLPATPYHYFVRAVQGGVEGADSNIATIVTPLLVGEGPGDCDAQQAVHTYVGAGGVTARGAAPPGTQHASGWYEHGVRRVADTCGRDLDGDGIGFDYDGDADRGVGAAVFIAGSNRAGCLAEPEVPHHAYGEGAAYWADDETGLATFAYLAGADGPALVPDPTNPCATDGIVSGDPTTDPLDCGAGAAGLYVPGALWAPATLGENVPGSGACDPFDGHVWVTLASGVVVGPAGPMVSTPIQGRIWS